MLLAVMHTPDGYIMYLLSFWLRDMHEKWFDNKISTSYVVHIPTLREKNSSVEKAKLSD